MHRFASFSDWEMEYNLWTNRHRTEQITFLFFFFDLAGLDEEWLLSWLCPA